MNEMIVKNVDVFGDSVMAAKDTNGVIWVGIRWMCKGMGMSDGQYKRQITNIQKDLLLKRGGSNLVLPTASGRQEVFCLQNDYLPVWLAKISITPTIQENNPELAEKLLAYQLKAKDILAAAFLPKQVSVPTTVQDQIKLLAQGTTELNQRVDTLQERMDKLEMDLPILPIEAEKITTAVKRRGVMVLGGKQSQAYRNRSIRQRVYNNLYANLKYNFGVKTYKAIKRCQCDKAVEIIKRYEPPFFLTEEIESENNH